MLSSAAHGLYLSLDGKWVFIGLGLRVLCGCCCGGPGRRVPGLEDQGKGSNKGPPRQSNSHSFSIHIDLVGLTQGGIRAPLGQTESCAEAYGLELVG